MIVHRGIRPFEVPDVPRVSKAPGDSQDFRAGDLGRCRSPGGPPEVPAPRTRYPFADAARGRLDFARQLENHMIGMPSFVDETKALVRGIVDATEQPIPNTGDLGVREAARVRDYLRERVLRELYLELDLERVRHGDRWSFLGWTTNGLDVDTARCEPFSMPSSAQPKRPLVMRLSVNTVFLCETEDPDWRYELMGGMEPDPSNRASRRLRTEISVLPHEMLSYVPFVAGLIETQSFGNPSFFIEPPPGTRFFGEGRERFTYLWSEAAWERIERFRATERARKARRMRAAT